MHFDWVVTKTIAAVPRLRTWIDLFLVFTESHNITLNKRKHPNETQYLLEPDKPYKLSEILLV